MPDPIEYLKKAYHGATNPLVPKEWTDPIGDYIDSPSLDRSPTMARIQGFGAGALEGLRQQTSPLNLVLAALPYVRGAAAGARGGAAGIGAMRAARSAESAVAPTLDIIEDVPKPQTMPSMSDVDDLIGDLTRNLAKIRPRTAAPAPVAPAAEYAAVGAEDAYNAGRSMPSAAPYGEGFYREMMSKLGGRGR